MSRDYKNTWKNTFTTLLYWLCADVLLAGAVFFFIADAVSGKPASSQPPTRTPHATATSVVATPDPTPSTAIAFPTCEATVPVSNNVDDKSTPVQQPVLTPLPTATSVANRSNQIPSIATPLPTGEASAPQQLPGLEFYSLDLQIDHGEILPEAIKLRVKNDRHLAGRQAALVLICAGASDQSDNARQVALKVEAILQGLDAPFVKTTYFSASYAQGLDPNRVKLEIYLSIIQ